MPNSVELDFFQPSHGDLEGQIGQGQEIDGSCAPDAFWHKEPLLDDLRESWCMMLQHGHDVLYVLGIVLWIFFLVLFA